MVIKRDLTLIGILTSFSFLKGDEEEDDEEEGDEEEPEQDEVSFPILYKAILREKEIKTIDLCRIARCFSNR